MAGKKITAYERIEGLIAADKCVILDGGVSTELERLRQRDHRVSDTNLWGTWALYHEPYAALDVHRRYLEAGCDIISTMTWAILDAPEMEAQQIAPHLDIRHWMDVARLGTRLARQAIDEAESSEHCTVGFSLNGDIKSPLQLERLQLLARVFDDEPPDLILMETMSLVRDGLTMRAVEIMAETGIPVWLSFRRCRHGVCGVHGQHWGGPEGDLFGRMASKFETVGVGALMVNCLPADHVRGMLSWLRDFTDLPLGAYPNLGRYLDPGWQFDDDVKPQDYADLAAEWRAEGAQIVGGCCGVTPEHMAAARTKLEGTKRGSQRVSVAVHPDSTSDPVVSRGAVTPWTDAQARTLYPLPLPDIVCDPPVFLPTQGSFLVWKHLSSTGAGKDKRCLDIGCGTGILTVQLALNGAEAVDAIDIQPEAVANTLTNAFRNGVADQVRGEVTDLYTHVPKDRYDFVVASLYQMPIDPTCEAATHRPGDFWGRNLLDHLIAVLPDVLEEDGVALVMQISILGQLRTSELMEAAGLESRVLDFAFFEFSEVFHENIEQIRRVEELSDAYHFTFGSEHVIVMYLLEVRRRPAGS